MTQDERWQKRYEEVVDFIETNKRNLSKYVAEEMLKVHFLETWTKAYECKHIRAGSQCATAGAWRRGEKEEKWGNVWKFERNVIYLQPENNKD
jgi:hypothetical protein